MMFDDVCEIIFYWNVFGIIEINIVVWCIINKFFSIDENIGLS